MRSFSAAFRLAVAEPPFTHPWGCLLHRLEDGTRLFMTTAVDSRKRTRELAWQCSIPIIRYNSNLKSLCETTAAESTRGRWCSCALARCLPTSKHAGSALLQLLYIVKDTNKLMKCIADAVMPPQLQPLVAEGPSGIVLCLE